MKEKSKNILISLIIALIVTGILGLVCYYTILKPINEMNEEMESKSAFFVDDVEDQHYQYILVQIIGFLIVVFCIATVLFYIVVERERKQKNN